MKTTDSNTTDTMTKPTRGRPCKVIPALPPRPELHYTPIYIGRSIGAPSLDVGQRPRRSEFSNSHRGDEKFEAAKIRHSHEEFTAAAVEHFWDNPEALVKLPEEVRDVITKKIEGLRYSEEYLENIQAHARGRKVAWDALGEPEKQAFRDAEVTYSDALVARLVDEWSSTQSRKESSGTRSQLSIAKERLRKAKVSFEKLKVNLTRYEEAVGVAEGAKAQLRQPVGMLPGTDLERLIHLAGTLLQQQSNLADAQRAMLTWPARMEALEGSVRAAEGN